MRRLLLSLIPSAVLALCLYMIDLPLWVESPGGARSVLPLISIDGAPTYDSEGRLLLTTVSLGRVNAYYALRAWLDPSATILTEREVLPPGKSDREYEQVSLSQMDSSKIAAVAVALRRITEYPDVHGPGAIVQNILAGSPADGRLFPGDLIVEIDGDPLDDLVELDAVIDAAGVAGDLEMKVRPVEGGETREVSVRLATDVGGDPLIGIFTAANFPYDVRIESGSIGGPSAGLMWALGVTDLLTAQDLTGDRVIAGTGTVDMEGNVGPIGGIGLKIEAAERAHAEIFLLPHENLAEAREAAENIRLLPVVDVEAAISYLEGLG
ncbi:MAG: YlbL family protein [Actinomycetota bacterium]